MTDKPIEARKPDAAANREFARLDMISRKRVVDVAVAERMAYFEAERMVKLFAKANEDNPHNSLNAHIAAAVHFYEVESNEAGKVLNVELSVGLKRFAIGTVRRGDTGRAEQDGRMIAGPWSYAFGLGSCIASSRLCRNPTFEVQTGDVIYIDGIPYRVRVYRREFVALERIAKDGKLHPVSWSY